MADSILNVTEMVKSRNERYNKQSTEEEISSISCDESLSEFSSDEEFENNDNYNQTNQRRTDVQINKEPGEGEENDLETAPANAETSSSYFISKNGTKWSKVAPRNTHNMADYIARNPGPVEQTASPYMIFRKLISDDMVIIILQETNRKAWEEIMKWNLANPTNKKVWKTITPEEFDAFLAIILHSGLHKSNNEPARELWDQTHNPIYKASMSYERFMFIKKFIRFDNPHTRHERLNNSKTAVIEDVWNIFEINLETAYIPYDSLTVCEQLYTYRGVTRSTELTSPKPAENGIKMRWLYDSKSFYPLKGMICSGKLEETKRWSNMYHLVKRYVNTGRTIYADKSFSTLDLAHILKRQNTAFVGRVCPSETFVPKEFLNCPERPVCSSLFGFYEGDITLCSYVPKKNKAVILMSTKHYTCDVDKTKRRKPIGILDYNANKSRMVTMDQMLGKYSCKRPTNRWSLAIFYNMLDVAALAAYIIFKEIRRDIRGDCQRLFMELLTKELAMGNIHERVHNARIMSYPGIQTAMNAFGIDTHLVSPICISCQIQFGHQHQTRAYCFTCNAPICAYHSELLRRCNTCTLRMEIQQGL